MGKLGWSYPAGCSGPPDGGFDDSACAACGGRLPPDHAGDEKSWAFRGFCGAPCALDYQLRHATWADDAHGGDSRATAQRAAGELWHRLRDAGLANSVLLEACKGLLTCSLPRDVSGSRFIAAARDAVAHAGRLGDPAGGWVEFPERTPAGDGRYLVYAGAGGSVASMVVIAWYDESGWSVPNREWAKGITHWRPLPPEPGQLTDGSSSKS